MTDSQKYQPLLFEKQIQESAQTVILTQEQIDGAEEYLKQMKEGVFKSEKGGYPHFQRLLDRVFGISPDVTKKVHFEHEIAGSEFSIFKKIDGADKSIVAIELKDIGRNLDKISKHGKKTHASPMTQLFNYFFHTDNNSGICSNYKLFVLFTRQYGGKRQHRFDFSTIDKNNLKKGTKIEIDEKKLKEFVGIFVNDLFFNNKITKYTEELSIGEIEITNEFYNLYHETRMMMIIFLENQEKLPKEEIVQITSLILNRLLFIFFAEDKGLLDKKNDKGEIIQNNSRIFRMRMKDSLESAKKKFGDNTFQLYNEITALFSLFKTGDRTLGIDEFNGGLFVKDVPRNLFKDNDETDYSKIIHDKRIWKDKHRDRDSEIANLIHSIIHLSPIFENLLYMEAYDFNTEISVDMLGHIFEKSLDDTDEIINNSLSIRKSDGAYYTPEQITDYICRTSIIKFLSKSDKSINTIQDLVISHADNIDNLEGQVNNLKILDPACGSGAFLLKSVDILLEILETIHEFKVVLNLYKEGENKSLDEHTHDMRARKIIKNNIFGVDINKQAVEIAKLSMFFKLSSSKKLPDLDENIKQGNSLIHPTNISHVGEKENKIIKTGKEMDENAFDWASEFPNIVTNSHGFDIIVSNPPWEKIKPSTLEFYAPLYEKTHKEKFRKQTKSLRNKFIKKIDKETPDIKQTFNEWAIQKTHLSNFFKNSSEYKLQDGGDVNLYKLFFEKADQLLNSKNGGVLGFVVPSGLCLEKGCKNIRKMIVDSTKILYVIGLINESGNFFKDVHKETKFCLIGYMKSGKQSSFPSAFKISTMKEFNDAVTGKTNYNFDMNIIRKSDINIIPDISKESESLLEKMYMHKEIGHYVNVKCGLHETANAYLFKSEPGGRYPIFGGKQIHQFYDAYETSLLYVDKEEIEYRYKYGLVNSKMHLGKKRKTNKFLEYEKGEKELKIADNSTDHEKYRIVWRDVTNSMDGRTLICTILPKKSVIINTLNYVVPEQSPMEMFYMTGMLNSLIVDAFMRMRVVLHINLFHFKGIPLPKYDSTNRSHIQIAINTAKLICKNRKYNELLSDAQKEFFIKSVDIANNMTENINLDDIFKYADDSERIGLQVQNSAHAAKIYNLNDDELKAALSFFKIDYKGHPEINIKKFFKSIEEEFESLIKNDQVESE